MLSDYCIWRDKYIIGNEAASNNFSLIVSSQLQAEPPRRLHALRRARPAAALAVPSVPPPGGRASFFSVRRPRVLLEEDAEDVHEELPGGAP